jgi:sarcosine oxidase
VPLLQRSWQLWEELNDRTGESICNRTGIIYIGRADSETIAGTRAAAAAHGLAQQEIDPVAARIRFDQFVIGDDDVVLYEDDGGYILTRDAIAAHLAIAKECGAIVKTSCRCSNVQSTPGGISATLNGEVVTARRGVVCVGAWTPTLLPTLDVELCVTRQVVGWLDDGGDERFGEGSMPVWTRDDPEGICWYGFPALDRRGVKVARHYCGEPTSAEEVNRTVTAEDEAEIRRAGRSLTLPAAAELKDTAVCMYTNSIDGHFVIDHDRSVDHLTVACGFSGHGFKMAPVIGEALADLATTGTTDLPIDFLMAERFDQSAHSR